jgi:hypothetical protein
MVTGIPLLGILWFFSFYGTCHEGDPCRSGEGVRALVVIGIVAIVAAVVGLATRSLVNRRVDRNESDG